MENQTNSNFSMSRINFRKDILQLHFEKFLEKPTPKALVFPPAGRTECLGCRRGTRRDLHPYRFSNKKQHLSQYNSILSRCSHIICFSLIGTAHLAKTSKIIACTKSNITHFHLSIEFYLLFLYTSILCTYLKTYILIITSIIQCHSWIKYYITDTYKPGTKSKKAPEAAKKMDGKKSRQKKSHDRVITIHSKISIYNYPCLFYPCLFSSIYFQTSFHNTVLCHERM